MGEETGGGHVKASALLCCACALRVAGILHLFLSLTDVFGPMWLIPVEAAFSLATFPYRGQLMKRRPKARKLLIVYEVREREHDVEILRFLHGAQIK